MEENEDFSWKDSKTATSNKFGRIVSIPPGPSGTDIKGVSLSLDKSKEEGKAIDVVKHRLDSATSRNLRKE